MKREKLLFHITLNDDLVLEKSNNKNKWLGSEGEGKTCEGWCDNGSQTEDGRLRIFHYFSCKFIKVSLKCSSHSSLSL